MGLSISVGILADIQENDPEMIGEFELQFEAVNAALIKHGYEKHIEPRDAEIWSDPLGLCGFPYSWVHYLRRYYAHRLAFPDRIPQVLEPRENAPADPLLQRMASRKSHLIWHSDCEGFYVPIDFSEVIDDEQILGGSLGSSHQLLTELRSIAAPLGFELQNDSVPSDQIEQVLKAQEEESPYFIERSTWLMLFDAAKHSLTTKADIVFG